MSGRKTYLDAVVGSVFNGVVYVDSCSFVLGYRYATVPALGFSLDRRWHEFDRDLFYGHAAQILGSGKPEAAFRRWCFRAWRFDVCSHVSSDFNGIRLLANLLLDV